MKTVRRPPYPKWNPGYFPCSSLTPLPLSSRRPSVSFGGFGLRVRKAPAMQRRKPTPLQTARWNAVQKAKRRGLSTRGVARELGIYRDTAKKYMEALSPPMKRDRVE